MVSLMIAIQNTANVVEVRITVYGKTFEEENFCGFRGFLANCESFPLESFTVYCT